jgi:hypothetical protein
MNQETFSPVRWGLRINSCIAATAVETGVKIIDLNNMPSDAIFVAVSHVRREFTLVLRFRRRRGRTLTDDRWSKRVDLNPFW